ncbi:hypothetical protein BLNAU_9783 [Blattamonas nauphoetae]|uniref:Uncharacterized protein n=1 Tax=Blattamonas nauphoetae TaxID=2049346 RepID=A0ABQ9XUT1_9EUKA|nr:hypothetical protein BLNAU_9783 [Blattamonas nauphoetae]
MSGSEIVFRTIVFSAAHLYVQTHQLVQTDMIAVDGVLDTFLFIFGVLRTSAKCCCPSLRIIFLEVLTNILTMTVTGNMIPSTLNHTTALITAKKYYTDAVKGITTAVCDASSTLTDKQDYSSTTLLTSGNSVSMMNPFTSVVDSRVILSPCWLSASLLIAHVTIVTVQHIVHRKIKLNKLQQLSSDEDVLTLFHSSGLSHSILKQIQPGHLSTHRPIQLARLSEICPLVSITTLTEDLSSLFRSFLCETLQYFVIDVETHPDLIDSFIETVDISSSPSDTPFRHDRDLTLISTLSQSSSPLFSKLSEPLLDPTFPLDSLLSPRSFTDPASSFFHLASTNPALFHRIVQTHAGVILDIAISTAVDTVRVVSDEPSEPHCLDFGQVTQNWVVLLNTIADVKMDVTQIGEAFNSLPSSLLTFLVLSAASTNTDMSTAAVSIFSDKLGLCTPHTEALLFATPPTFPVSDAFTPRHPEVLGEGHAKGASQSICAEAGCCVVLKSRTDLDFTTVLGIHFAGCLVTALHSTTTLPHSFPFFSSELSQSSRQPNVWNDSSQPSALTALATLADLELRLAFQVPRHEQLVSHTDDERRDTICVHLFPILGAESQAQFLSSFHKLYTARKQQHHSSLDRMVECLVEMVTVTSYHTPIALLTKLKKVAEFLSCFHTENHFFKPINQYISSFERSLVEKLKTAEGEERWRLLTQLVVVSLCAPDIASELTNTENDAQALFILSINTIRSTTHFHFHPSANPDAFRRVVELASHSDNLPLVAAALPHIGKSVEEFVLPPGAEAFCQIEPKKEFCEIVIRSLRMIASHRREGGTEGCVVGKDEMTSQIVMSCFKLILFLMSFESFDPTPIVDPLVSQVVTTDLALLRSILYILEKIEERTRTTATPFSISTATAPFRGMNQSSVTQQPLPSIIATILLSASLDTVRELSHQNENPPNHESIQRLSQAEQPNSPYRLLRGLNEDLISDIAKEMAKTICLLLEESRTSSSRSLKSNESFSVSFEKTDRNTTPLQLLIAFLQIFCPESRVLLPESIFIPLAPSLTRLLTIVVPSSPDRVEIRSVPDDHLQLLDVFLKIFLSFIFTGFPASISSNTLSSLLSVLSAAFVRLDAIPSSLPLIGTFYDMFKPRENLSNSQVNQIVDALSEEGMEDRSDLVLDSFSLTFLNNWRGANTHRPANYPTQNGDYTSGGGATYPPRFHFPSSDQGGLGGFGTDPQCHMGVMNQTGLGGFGTDPQCHMGVMNQTGLGDLELIHSVTWE